MEWGGLAQGLRPNSAEAEEFEIESNKTGSNLTGKMKLEKKKWS
jgi:hypothetical protein